MRVRRRGTRLLVSLIGLICLTALAACASGTVTKPPTETNATNGPITVTTNLSAYSVSEAIGVTVSNTSKTNYYAVNGKSACVLIQLERYNSTKGVWEAVDGCQSNGTAQPFVVAKNTQQQFTLAPNSSADANSWEAGLYRVTVTYSAKTDGVTDPQLARSAAFNVR